MCKPKPCPSNGSKAEVWGKFGIQEQNTSCFRTPGSEGFLFWLKTTSNNVTSTQFRSHPTYSKETALKTGKTGWHVAAIIPRNLQVKRLSSANPVVSRKWKGLNPSTPTPMASWFYEIKTCWCSGKKWNDPQPSNLSPFRGLDSLGGSKVG